MDAHCRMSKARATTMGVSKVTNVHRYKDQNIFCMREVNDVVRKRNMAGLELHLSEASSIHQPVPTETYTVQ